MNFENQSIIDKVNTLREERNMNMYCAEAKIEPEVMVLTKKIITMIQFAIFVFDDLCEKNVLPKEHLQLLLDNTKKTLFGQVSIVLHDDQKAIQYTQRLFSFYEMEMDMRRAKQESNIKNPLDYSLEAFYVLKSCDVFLSRQIVTILTNQPELYNEGVGIFDQLGEVLDDMMDVEEDIDAINSNRFLISLVKKGVAETIEEYYNFVYSLLHLLHKQEQQLKRIGLDVQRLRMQLNHYFAKDWSWVARSKTNELLFGNNK